MTLARAWTQRMFGASLVAVLVPGAVLGAVAVAALTGGFGRISDLTQALSGPQLLLPPAAVRAPRVAHRGSARRGRVALRRPGARVAVVGTGRGAPAATAPRVAAPGAPTGAEGVAGGGTGATVGSGAPGRGGSPPGSSGGSKPAPGAGAGGSGAPGAPGAPGTGHPAPPGPAPTLTDRVIGVASGVTSRLPSPAGPAATQVLNQAGDALDKLVPAPPAGGSGPGGSLP